MINLLDLCSIMGMVLTEDACRSRAEGMWSSSAPLMPTLTLGLDPNARARLIWRVSSRHALCTLPSAGLTQHPVLCMMIMVLL